MLHWQTYLGITSSTEYYILVFLVFNFASGWALYLQFAWLLPCDDPRVAQDDPWAIQDNAWVTQDDHWVTQGGPWVSSQSSTAMIYDVKYNPILQVSSQEPIVSSKS